jgi:iron complex transport system permease protein
MVNDSEPARFRWIWGAIGLAVVFLASFMIGRFPVAPHQVAAILASQVLPIDPFWPAEAATIVLKVRLPRILAAMLVGAALSSSGAAFQGVFRNPMVSPDILGVAAGAGFGASLAILAGLSGAGIQAAAFVCGLAAVAVTYGIGRWQGNQGGGVLVMVLAGIIVGTVFAAGISLVKYVADPANTLPAITFWLMGSLASVTSRDLGVAALPVLLGLAQLHLLRWRLNLLSFGDDEARALGVDVGKTRLVVIVAATLMTASSVAISGVIGLVGLVVPHLARMLVGPNYRILLPTCSLLGAGFLLAVDDLARSLSAGEVPLGILTSLLGAPFFLALLVNIRKGWAS